ncbi:SLAP domain-containing protein [Ornithinibacillus contaminans]|uniref:SLAP domain-containing protein n=1 Tax=Ornithinibacillus contaminans TaxID=694055 RepID=UPI00064D8549|nr:SLAP domain-containing protein [Ornithinibacillus contaminans]
MQSLVYEAAWDKTISVQDRTLIEETFQKVNLKEEGVHFTPLRWDKNYKNELLIMVLVHNNTDQELAFDTTKISYIQKERVLAMHTFTLPNLLVKHKTSMPWTFIFPVGTYNRNGTFQEGNLILAE